MRSRRRAHPFLFVLFITACGAGAAASCSATDKPNEFTSGSGGEGPSGSTSTTSSGAGGSGEASASSGEGGGITLPDAGSPDAEADVITNPCGTQCGDKELCDEDHVGLDDDCDNQVDEDCPCAAGQAHACFKGDPSYHGAKGCFDGSMKCTENGAWGPCLGGVHVENACYANDTKQCHVITASPFQDVNLKEGTGDFSLNADPGSEAWTVACPTGVDPCPGVSGMGPADDFKPLQSGEYTVTYTKSVQGAPETCSYPLIVGAPGLRVELQWEHNLGGDGVDLDLHVHKPNDLAPWSINGAEQDCGWGNCVIADFVNISFDTPFWFNPANMAPDPVNWYLDPIFERNTCYFAPRGVGDEWQDEGQGCHNPRLDLDNITCDPAVVDPNNGEFCAPENINVDFPPKNEWTRIAVHYYGNHGKPYDVHPVVKVFCNGALAAELGPTGYYDPEAPIAFAPYEGEGFGEDNRFWLVAEVAFKESKCGSVGCVVKPIYSDPTTRTPFLTYGNIAESNVGPAYPPPP